MINLINFEEEIEKEKRAEVLLKKQEELNSLIKEKNFEIKKIQLDLSNKESKRMLLEKEIEELEKKLEAEGHTIIQKGRKNVRYYVKDYENSLFVLK